MSYAATGSFGAIGTNYSWWGFHNARGAFQAWTYMPNSAALTMNFALVYDRRGFLRKWQDKPSYCATSDAFFRDRDGINQRRGECR